MAIAGTPRAGNGYHMRDPSRSRAGHLVHHDALTGVLNRFWFDRAFADLLTTSRQAGTGGAVLFLDLEHFKTVNNNFGHAAGDALLVCVAQRLCASVRQNDLRSADGRR